ncbi:peptidyl-tRNA hydrolase, PTH1 family [Ruminococcaceae bacterium YRB3002]|nr:peptidyl-tRNA hydrolase, PTH1 family [Ruminococcaceae bacterium YRB3002]
MWLIVGLGNPGLKYYKTWHNMGFLAIDLLAEKTGITIGKSKFDGEYGKGKIEGEDVILLKPFTYMNNSGISVAAAAKFFKVQPSHILVIYDDIDIARGKIRVRTKGSAGTHNGMKSIIEHLGTNEFPRVRIGTGPVPEHWDLVDYVLSNVPEGERKAVFDSFELACDAVKDYIKGKYE